MLIIHYSLVSNEYLKGARDENEFYVNEELAVADAQKLHEAGNEMWNLTTQLRSWLKWDGFLRNCLIGEAKRGTDECEFNLILGNRSFLHLKRVMDEYKLLRGHSLKKAIKAEFSGMTVAAMHAICKYSLFCNSNA